MNVNLKLYTDSNYAPSSLLYSTSFQTPGGGNWDGATNLDWRLGAGTYWVSFEPTNSYGMMPYYAPNPADHESQYFMGKWHLTYAGVGLKVLSSDTGDTGGGAGGDPGGVPEPATWAMMLGGFALAGVAMRRRRHAALV
jgi:hypothetical protein